MTLSIQNFTQNFCVILLLFYRIFLGSQRLFSSLLDCVRKVLILAIFDREKPPVSPSPTIILHSLYKINENHRVLHRIQVCFEYRTKIIESLWQQHASQQTLLMYQLICITRDSGSVRPHTLSHTPCLVDQQGWHLQLAQMTNFDFSISRFPHLWDDTFYVISELRELLTGNSSENLRI